jgi:nitrate reductase / nitrite oxidoreductase, alpha subunit
VRTTCSPNCTGSCGQLAFVRDDRVVKIQQAADFPDPVYNPRGCMKGLSFHHNIHGADRIQTPLIRTGPRGSGEFREASWDEVLDRIADEFSRIGRPTATSRSTSSGRSRARATCTRARTTAPAPRSA